MLPSLLDTFERESRTLSKRFDEPLRAIARRSVKVWFNCDRLDRELSAVIKIFPLCELVYAIDADGHQVSSNIFRDSIDRSAFGQDLSKRPIAVSLFALSNASQRGAFLCDAYISRVSRRPCLTVMYTVTSGPSTMGFIAADFDPELLAGNST